MNATGDYGAGGGAHGIRALDTTPGLYEAGRIPSAPGCVGREKLFAFLRDHRHELFDDGFQAELEAMYRDTGAGREPVPPALLAMTRLVTEYLGMSDAEAVELTWWTCAGRWCWIAWGGQTGMCPGDTGGFSRTAHPH